MTEQEKRWFDALATDRMDSANTMEKPSMRGNQRSVVDKYSDQAHFIYELLQNADDVMATSARFRLQKDGLFFIHNGSIHFTVSDPETEDTDKDRGALGHINSITSIANSNKPEGSIGKFGVGFKAVFQYTQTPHIYDPQFQFKIERFIVPRLLDADLTWRETSETAFWFPFDHNDKTPAESFEEVVEKLKSLDLPILFLSHLRTIVFETHDISGSYTKRIDEPRRLEDIELQRVEFTFDLAGVKTTQRLLTFARKADNGSPYSIGYGLKKEEKLAPMNRPAFCFFPTKEATNLNFILHAPFLLTDSRESIKAGEKHNQELIRQLAQLAADSLPILRDERLIDDGLLDIIPYDQSRFSALDDRVKISFRPFYDAIKHKLQADTLLPAADGGCCSRGHAYWASDTELAELFSDRQLAQLTGTTNARWVFRSRGKKEVQSTDRALAEFIDGGNTREPNSKESNLIISSLEPSILLRKITRDFVAAQPMTWLHKLYRYLSERASYQDVVKEKPIFLDQNSDPVPAFDGNKQLILFLPDDEIEGYTTVNKDLLSDEATREFIDRIGVRKPSLRDEIYNKILPAYKPGAAPDTTSHFSKFFRYFKECKNEDVAKYIELIQDKKFLRFTTAGDSTVYHHMATSLYLPTPELKEWFEAKPDTRFLLLDEYRGMVEPKENERLMEFLKRLGVAEIPRVVDEASDKRIDGLEELIAGINAKRSVALWKRLVASWSHYENAMHARKNQYGPRGGYKGSEPCDTAANKLLRTGKWLLNSAGELVSRDDVTIQSLSDQYYIFSSDARSLIAFLKIHDETEDASRLSEEEARKIRLADELEKSGLSEDEIRAAIVSAKQRKTAIPQTDGGSKSDDPAGTESPIIRDITNRLRSRRNSGEPKKPRIPQAEPGDDGEDTDGYTPRAVDFGKTLDRTKDRYASEIDRIERQQALHDKANALPRYSYGWFLALLELECMASRENNADGRTLSIRFGRVECDAQSSRTVVLREPSRSIPQSIEEMSGVRVDLDYGNGRTGKLRVESFTAKEFSLLGKLESANDLSGVDLDAVVEARIEVQSPSFLLEELLKRFRELQYEDQFDMKTGLTADIEFVFGPPGTGKTTHLAEKVLIPRMIGGANQRVLVLTPTNKAADVLTLRIMERMAGDTSYLNWLIRFGTSADERIERAGVWRDRSFNISALNQSVTITAIARFAYDGFAGEHGRKLYEMDWDAIVVDEASMISLASIIYPLYRQKPERFIIAGDPFQIEPIVAVEHWRDENIYTLVGLNKSGAFASPATQPRNYLVTNLEVQYRSIPAIGEIFSHFTYDGILKHHRKAESQRPLVLKGVPAKPLNLIKFPVSKYESIYRAKRLETGTPYQTYAALFAFEFVRWLAEQVQGEHSEKFRIGVIAPYRAQANLLNKLNDSWAIKPDTVGVQVGTIHGFQGDECDAIIAVFNPPPAISRDPRMFLNKQNILNVAISRARDYLFIVMPDRETEGIENLHKIARIEELMGAGGACEYESCAIERMIWNNPGYIEQNTFSTGHQTVNVYRRPERYYEVRCDTSAIDVQIREAGE